MTQTIYDTAAWTERDRAFIDIARNLAPDEMDFMGDLMQFISADPVKSEARKDFARQQANRYHLRTAEGRQSFLQALRAI